jgi:Cu-Zn family superoxide dismutase
VASFARPELAARLVAVALAACGVLVACESKGPAESKGALASPAIGARLASKGGSVVKGLVLFKPREGGTTMVIQLHDVTPGRYRVAIHTTGNCSSPNAFSAGPPWTPTGGAPQVYEVAVGGNGLLMTTASLDGVAVDGANGVLGKSVVVHFGATSPLTAEPGVANDRVACGVIERLTSLEL